MTTINVTPSLLKGYNIATFAKPDVTAAGSSGAWTTANSPITLFTVTGLVELAVFGVVTTLLTSAGPGTGTLALGTVGSSTGFIAATTVDGSTKLLLNNVWLSTTSGNTSEQESSTVPRWQLSNSGNAVLTIAVNNMTAGGMTIYCYWRPISSGATVVAATP